MTSFAGYRSWNFCGRLGVNSATALRTTVGSNEDIGCNHADMNVERAGDEVETRMRRRGQFLASRCSRRGLVRDQFADVDSSRLRTVCGQFVTADDACSRTVEIAMCSRMRTVCDRACGRGLSADMDSSRTRTNRVRGLFPTGLSLWTCQGCGHGTLISRGCSAFPPRPIRGQKILVTSRGSAYIKLNTLRNTLPVMLPQFVSPAFQLGHDGLDASNLFDGLGFDARGIIVSVPRVGQLYHDVRCMIINPFFEVLQHFDGSAQLPCGWCS